MDIILVLTIVTFIMVSIMLITQYIDACTPKVCNVLGIMNILPCYEIKAFRNGKRIQIKELIDYLNSPVKAYQLSNGILYIEID
jgi:hypothetical protein